MPWTASSVMEERLRFVARLLDGESMTEVCREFGISRKTGYKIFDRYKEHGLAALTDRSRRPVRYANQLPVQVETLIVRLKGEKPHWGARKIRELLVRRLSGDVRVPARSTIHAVLDRHGLVKRGGRPRQQRDAVYVIKARVRGRQRFITIGTHGKPWTPETARRRAIELFGLIAGGGDPAGDRDDAKMALTLEVFAERYLREHARPKKKRSSVADDERNLENHIKPALGRLRLTDITHSDIVKLHASMQHKPIAANRCLSLLSHMFTMAEAWGLVPESLNPCRRVERYREEAKERFLTTNELHRLGDALREAETIGILWEVDELKRGVKHLARPENRRTIISPYATAAIRLLLFTGARLREVLGLRWEWIDFERKLISKGVPPALPGWQ